MRLGEALVTCLTALALAGPVAKADGTPAVPTPQTLPQEEAPPPLPALNAISRYEGLIVGAIEFRGIEKDDIAQMRGAIEQKAGESLDRERVRQSIQTLYATGRLANVQVEAELTAEHQVTLTFVGSPNFFVGLVRVEAAFSHPSANQIANASKLQLGEVFTREKLERALDNMQRLLQENGYYHAGIDPVQQQHPETQQVDILFRINPGSHAHAGKVEVQGHPGYSQGQVQDMAKLHPDDPVAADRVTRALDRLRKKYAKQNRLLAQVSVEHTYRAEANVVDYTFHIEPGPQVEILAEGFKVSRGTIKKNVPVYEENAFDDDLLNEGRRNLLSYLQTRGYFDATVGIKKQSDPSSDRLRAIYVINPGARHKLVKIAFSGNNFFLDDNLREVMQVLPAGRLLSHGRYSQSLLGADLRTIEDLYRSNGFAQVKVSSSVLDDYQGRENDLAVQVQIEEGPQTLVSALHVVGNQSVPELPYLNIQAGQPYSDVNIASDREIILNYYFNHGFPDATFEASSQTAAEPNRMDVTYTIHEGRQIFVDDVLLYGLHYTRPFVVRREVQIKPGDPVSELSMIDTQTRLYDLGIFSQVDTAVQNPDGIEADKNVLVGVQEAKRYTFNYGLGLEFQTGQPTVGTNQPQGETGVSPRVSFEVTRLNFRGRNHTITFKAHVGRLQQRGLVSYEAPRWFNSRDWRLGFTAFYDNTLDVTTFTSERLEGSVQAEQVLTRALNEQPVSTLTYRFTYRRVRASNLVISENQIPLLSQPVRVGMPGFTYIRDKRDNPLETRKGNYTTLDGGVASGYFGSEASFGRLLIQNSTYQPFGRNRRADRKYVFARSTRIGVEVPYGNTIILRPGQSCPNPAGGPCSIPLPELFLSGGGNSHRGFGLNQAGPRDPQTGFPLGGSALFINNLELRFPPVTLPYLDDNVSFAIFHDMGNVFTSGNDLLHSLLRWKQPHPERCLQESTATQCNYDYISHAIGVGVRYKTPIGPVRFDFGYSLTPEAFPSFQTVPDPNDPSKQISTFVPEHARRFNIFFSIGQTF